MKKIVKTFLIFSILLVTSSVFAFSTTATGKELLEYCKIAMDIHDKQFGNPQTDPAYILGAKTGICEGYLMSAAETRIATRNEKSRTQCNVASFCLPPSYNLLVGASVVVKYLKDHPEQENLPASLLVARSLQTYFPCIRR